MSDTKMAMAALMALATSDDFGPDGVQALVAALKLLACVYLTWYLWRGPEPVERKRAKRRQEIGR